MTSTERVSSVLLLIFLLLNNLSVQAQTSQPAADNTRSYTTHVMKQHETLFSVSKKFHTTPDELLKINPGLPVNNIATGSKIKVPVVTAEIKKRDREKEKMLKHAILYTVQKKETLYTIAKKNNIDVTTLMSWNNLSKASVDEGQQLIVGFTKPKYAPKVIAPVATLPTSKSSSSNDKPVDPASAPISPDTHKALVTQQGTGEWIKGVNDDGNFYALHPTAPIGSIITVKNLMNNKTVTVKVVGKLPATSENEHLVIKLSSSAAKALNILDAKFRVELTYAGQ